MSRANRVHSIGIGSVAVPSDPSAPDPREAQENTARYCPDMIWCCALHLIPLFWPLMPGYCRQYIKEIKTWDKLMREWQDDFNREVLRPRGMFIKTQSHCVRTSGAGPDDPGSRSVSRWFAIALTEEDSVKLQGEPHITGSTDHVLGMVTCISDLHERDLCMHYE